MDTLKDGEVKQVIGDKRVDIRTLNGDKERQRQPGVELMQLVVMARLTLGAVLHTSIDT